ncbi:hypothetical protein KKA33_00340 [Patescibacteria group bacterium]|nr:hypothetical protein [Patescibacteria group bacterium]
MKSTISNTLRKLTAKVATLIMLTGMLSPLNAVADDASKGVLNIFVNPPEGTYQVLNDVTGETVISMRSGNLSTTLDAGDYLIQYQDVVDGYAPPADEPFRLPAGGEVSIIGTYEDLNPVTEGILNVFVSPAEGRYEVLNNVTGAVVIPERSGNLSTNLDFGDYVVTFKDISDEYITPGDVEFDLGPDNLEETVVGNYEFIESADQGILNVFVSPAEGRYEVLNNVTGAVVIPERSGNLSTNLDFGDYVVTFKDISDEYITPADVEFDLGPDNLEETVVGNYTTVPGTGTVVVRLVNQDYETINDGDWEINSCTDVNDVNSCTVFHANGIADRTLLNVPEGIYGISAELTPGYSARTIISLNPQDLEAGNTIAFTIMYVEETVVDELAGIQVTTQPIAGGVRINGQPIGKPSNAGDYIPATPYLVNAAEENVISFETEMNYNTPADIVIPANSLTAGEIYQYTGTYTSTGVYGQVIVNVKDDQGNAFSSADYDILRNGTIVHGPLNDSFNQGSQRSGQYSVNARSVNIGGADYNPAITLISASDSIVNQGDVVEFDLAYTKIQPTTGRVTVNQNGAVGTVELILPGPVTVSVNQAVYDNASAPAGAYTLGTITAPAGFQLTNVTDGNGVALAVPFAQSLNINGQITYNVNYTAVNNPVVTVSKAVDFATRQNGEYAQYTIMIARSDNLNTAVNVDVVDTISGANALTGNNGGQLSLIPNSAGCTAANNGQCGLGLITNAGGMNINLPNANSSVQIIYRVQAVNAGIPNNQNSAVINTVNILDSNGQTATASVTVTVAGPQSGNNNSGCTVNCGGGGGGGGGMIMMLGDMELLVEKLISLNGVDYRDASSHDLAVVVPENKSTRLYTKVRITNDNDVSAKNVKFNPFFDTGDSDMTANEIEDIQGAKLTNGNLIIEKIKAGETVEFSYSVLVHENGQNSNPAFDGVEVVDYESTLPISQDGLTYVTKGEQFVTYIYAGQIPAAVIKPVGKDSGNDSDVLSIQVSADRAEARIGETVNYTVTLQNVSDIDLTNLLIAHSYAAELDVINTGGGRDDGRELHFSRAIMRPGESVSLQFSAKVVSGSAGQVVRSLTRVLVNEFENISPAESYLMIAGGTAPAGPDYRLAQTGSGLLMSLLLSLLAYLGYGAIQKRRYQALKKEALKF